MSAGIELDEVGGVRQTTDGCGERVAPDHGVRGRCEGDAGAAAEVVDDNVGLLCVAGKNLRCCPFGMGGVGGGDADGVDGDVGEVCGVEHGGLTADPGGYDDLCFCAEAEGDDFGGVNGVMDAAAFADGFAVN